ncbi:Aste57867_25111 [Aphanomyces stellatus]|uniref:Aste57867_25111 protein n=1 Tax=Aphanomyces stellatus TaxID=120398 RepID=A0A485LSZ3_9STRA|nr:hypothetical protein As57867_025033 [Aphanomyces stellatus]VFU01742.1 Aste57867_25111 [Aphanomyces stellatus]
MAFSCELFQALPIARVVSVARRGGHCFPMRVYPQPAHPPWSNSLQTKTTPQFMFVLVGCGYLVLSLVSSIYYLDLLEPSFANDLWWSDYSSNRAQALTVDLFNALLTTHATGPVDFLATTASVDKVYVNTMSPTTDMYPTYPRRLALLEFTSVEYAVPNLRSLAAFWFGYMLTQYCWVDLHQEYELAHTAARQQRCATRYATNGAMYMETVLRNLDWDSFLQNYGGDGGMFTISIQLWLEQHPSGQLWLQHTATARNMTTIGHEVAYWKACNISYFQLQWQNGWQTGVGESIVVENALGIHQVVPVKSMPFERAFWTSAVLYWVVFNDFYYASAANRSLIRSADNSISVAPPLNFEGAFGLQDVNGDFVDQIQVFRTTVGPFLSVDTVYVPVPPTLLVYYESYQSALFARLEADVSLRVSLDAIPSVTWQPTPPSWASSNFMFYGGNPMCLHGGPLPYVQETFSFSDACTSQSTLSMATDKYSSLFAATIVGTTTFQPEAVCALQVSVVHCRDYVVDVALLVERWRSVSISPPLVQALESLNISIMQFATIVDGTNWTLLRQPLVDGSAAWTFFGWTMMYDWIQGHREVVSFEGDIMSLVLISAADTPQTFPSNANSISSATRVIYYLVVYVTAMLCVLGTCCLVGVSLLRFDIHGLNFVWFNRIVGSIWIGRPLIFFHGLTAILVLSTSQLEMVTMGLSHTRFEFAPRSWLATMIVAGEATWVLYAAQDFLSVFPNHMTPTFGPLSNFLAWITLVVLEWLWPVLPSGSIKRACSATNMDYAMDCTSGVLQIGSFQRVRTISVVLIASLGLGFVVGSIYRWFHSNESPPPRHLLGSADPYLSSPAGAINTTLPVDKVSSLMAGLVPFVWSGTEYAFDVKLWVLHGHKKKPMTTGAALTLAVQPRPASGIYGPYIDAILPPSTRQLWLKRTVVVLGMLYVVSSIVSSVSYLQVSSVALSNDLFWTAFNMTSTHAFIGTWLSQQLLLGTSNITLHLTEDNINQDGAFDKSVAVFIPSAVNFGGLVQYSELNSIEAMIVGLRSTDACLMPWIFTQYCFVDFNQQWELANSAARQARCQTMTTNGAVFLESILRNIPFQAFYSCWGVAFETAIASELRRSTAGQTWLRATTSSPKVPVADEVALWRAHNLATFNIQWQNFKQIGLINSYSILNACGTSYALTLQNKPSLFLLKQQTTFKLYWGLANDFIAVTQNSSIGIGGLSLIRSSPAFAFANRSMEAVLVENATLVSPLVASFTAFSSTIGPFGSIDVHYVACPREAKLAIRVVKDALRTTLAQNMVAQTAYNAINDPSSSLWPAPKVWTDLNFVTVGGDPLCPELAFQAGQPIFVGLLSLLSNFQCTSASRLAVLTPTREAFTASVLLANMSNASFDDVAIACVQDVTVNTACMQLMTQASAFVNTYMASHAVDVAPLIAAATLAIRRLNVELIQFGKVDATSPLVLYRTPILDPNDVGFTIFAWNFLMDWALGLREAVSFEGDYGTLAVLTEYSFPYGSHVNEAEESTSMAFYLRNTVRYVTWIMILVAAIVLLYILIGFDAIEVWNILSMHRVGSLVWVGRPLLVVRSFTAVALLSTCTLELVFNGNISYFQVVQDPWYKIILAANEVTWLVAVVDDITMALTREFTSRYAMVSSIVIWLFAVTLGFTSPMSHSMTIAKRCHVAQVDFHIVCDSGVLAIGHFARLAMIVVVVFVSNGLSYAATRILMREPPRNKINSHFVYAGARYLFTSSKWIFNGVYYMDRMSAVLNGIITLQWGAVLYGLDIKLWRVFHVDVPNQFLQSNPELAAAAQFALPLTLDLDESMQSKNLEDVQFISLEIMARGVTD